MTTSLDAIIKANPNRQKLINVLYKHGMQCRWDPPTGGLSRLLIFGGECNGIIYDYETWKLLCNPPSMTKKYNLKTLSLTDYTAYAAQDGTVINLYFYNGQWYVSTIRGFDMGDVKWNGVTYWEALEDAKFNKSILVPGITYTFGLSHPKMHALALSATVCYISSYDGERHYDKPPSGMTCQPKLEIKTVEELKSALAGDSFGVILRSPTRNILIESQRMKDLRTLVYDQEITLDAKATLVDRWGYVATYAAMDMERTDRVMELAPKLTSDVKKVQAAIAKIVDEAVAGKPTQWDTKIDAGLPLSAERNSENVRSAICDPKYVSDWYYEVLLDPVLDK